MRRFIADPSVGALSKLIGAGVAVLAGMMLLAASPATLLGQKGDASVLRALLAGTEWFWQSDTAKAAEQFDLATRAIEGIWGGTAEAAKARTLWYEERVKPFRGEAYERTMAFYYRGLLYMQQRDWGNAQASFRNAVLQDAFAEEEQFQSDVSAALLLMSFALETQGSRASAARTYEVLRERRGELPPWQKVSSANVIVVVETGTAPRKVSDGLNAEKLRYFRGKFFDERAAYVTIDSGPPQPVWPMEDVFFQASTRGGRPVDFMLQGKAQFANSTSARSLAFADLGSALSMNLGFQQMQFQMQNGRSSSTLTIARQASDGMEALGAVVSLVGALVKPAADVRAWSNLPDGVHVLPLTLGAGPHRLTFDFVDSTARLIPPLQQQITIMAPAPGTGPSVVWLSSRPRVAPPSSR